MGFELIDSILGVIYLHGERVEVGTKKRMGSGLVAQ